MFLIMSAEIPIGKKGHHRCVGRIPREKLRPGEEGEKQEPLAEVLAWT